VSRDLNFSLFNISKGSTFISQLPFSSVTLITFTNSRCFRVVILHTSGSTGNPKPIFYNNAYMGYFDVLHQVPDANGLQTANPYAVNLGPDEHLYMCFPIFHLVGKESKPTTHGLDVF